MENFYSSDRELISSRPKSEKRILELLEAMKIEMRREIVDPVYMEHKANELAYLMRLEY